MDHSCVIIMNYFEFEQVVLEKKILKFPIKLYKENWPRPWRPCFFRYHYSLNNFGRGPPMDHSCEITLKSDQ